MRVDKNKDAICERGWFPYNRNLLNNASLRSTMTDADIASESESTVVIIPTTAIGPVTDQNIYSTPTVDPAYLIESQQTVSYDSEEVFLVGH